MTEGTRDVRRPGRSRLAMLLAGAVLVVLVMTAVLWTLDLRAESGLPLGAHDFIQHSAAFDVALEDGDPYDDATLRTAENRLYARYDGGAQRFWYPPWMLLVLAPVIALPFELATALWIVLTLAGGFAVTVISWRLFRTHPDDPPPPVVLGLALLFVPLLACLVLGQMGVLIAVLLLGGMLALRNDREVLAGCLLALTIVRPQVVLLPLLVLGVHLIATRRFVVIRSALVTAGAVVLGSVVAFPSVWAAWDPIGGSPTHFQTPTLSTMLRLALSDGGSGAPEWPVAVVPLLAAMATAWWAWRRRHEIAWDLMPVVLAVSVLASPYSWIYDSMLLMPIHVLALGGLVRTDVRSRALGVLAVALQLAALYVRSLPTTAHDDLIIVPVGLLVLYLAARWIRVTSAKPAAMADATAR